ncbi:putative RNA polymerase II transcriptional coactivator [Lytechinus variegatus]|uniref:putative RNA polymerase II transcriptional coactivator n=1 Tax=Lytechinus variegatus TaxID=7654 RepID=UPI001BB1FDF4|nr:putative RNA polymerase II transcriptional coactivator [Lytechinus variegatus]
MEGESRENGYEGFSSSVPLFIEEGQSNIQPVKQIDQSRNVEGKDTTSHQSINGDRKGVETGKDIASNTGGRSEKNGTHIAKYPISGKDGRAKYVTVRNFRGQVYVDIRDFYESGGEYFPSKKGITLTAREFKAIMMISKNITRAIYSGQNK